MAKGKSPVLPILGIAGLGVFAWLNWTRIKQVSHQLYADIGGQQPQWAPGVLHLPGTIPGPEAPPGSFYPPFVPTAEVPVDPVCKVFPDFCTKD